jgi:hypothetical protein
LKADQERVVTNVLLRHDCRNRPHPTRVRVFRRLWLGNFLNR